MKATGMTRPIDPLGRIVVPMELRRSLYWEPKDTLEVFVSGQEIVLCKYKPACIFCGEATNLIDFGDRKFCPSCIQKLADCLQTYQCGDKK